MGTTPVGVSVVVNVMVGVEVGSKDDVGVNVTLGVTVLATRWAPWRCQAWNGGRDGCFWPHPVPVQGKKVEWARGGGGGWLGRGESRHTSQTCK